MPWSLRLLSALHYLVAFLNALWTAFFAWVLGQAMWQLAPLPWSACNLWDRLFWLLGPLLLVLGATAVVLNFQAPGWIRRRERLATCQGLSMLNLVPLISFFGLGLPVALYALWLFRQPNIRAWFAPTDRLEPDLPCAAAAISANPTDLPVAPPATAGPALATAVSHTAPTPMRKRRRTTQLLAEAVR